MDTTDTVEYRCGCGEWAGEPCEWVGSLSDLVVMEYMPVYLRETHTAAGNSGIWPHNGAERVACYRECAETLLEDPNEYEWARLLDGADPAEYADSVEEDEE